MQSNLNDKQKEAVYLGLGPALILAGPGSGKTTVILERIKYLIFELNISPKNILVITYTKSAAREMRTRAIKYLNHIEEMPFFGTFHSYFYSVLKRSYEYRNFSILTTKQKNQNLENFLKIYHPNIHISGNLLQDILTCVSKQKNGMECANEVENLGFSDEEFLFLCNTLSHFYYEQKQMDYDDIILLTQKLLKNNPHILTFLRKEIKYILIDEFQDVNKTQYELISILAGQQGNIFVVGDDDQSIYRFRGAGEENLRRFERDFTPVRKVFLDINYRCPKEIVRVSENLIGYNKKRFQKELRSGKMKQGCVVCRKFVSKEEERKFIIESIKKLSVETGKDKILREDSEKNIAILCRTNSQLSFFAEILKKENIFFYMKEKKVKFYDIPYIRPIIGYLMFASGVDKSRKCLFTFLNQPMRYINREVFANWNNGDKRLDNINTESSVMRSAIGSLYNAIQKISWMRPEIAINYILKVLDYENYVLSRCKAKEECKKIRTDIEELKERAKMYATIREWMEYVKWEELADEPIWKAETEKDVNVFLYTFHGAKGLEFDTVLIPHLNEGSVPYGKNLTVEELEEERRMFYVALTRSSNTLYITYTDNNTKKDTVSRFIRECSLTASK